MTEYIIVTFYNPQNGQIAYVYSGSNLEANNDNNMYSFITGEYSADKYYIVNEQPIVKADKPNQFSRFDYDTKTWVTDLALVKSKTVLTLKQSAQDLIFKYLPQTTQANLQARVSELDAILTAKILILDESGVAILDNATGLYLMQNGRVWTTAEQHEWASIQLKRNWIKSVRDASNLAELAINSASSVESVMQISSTAYDGVPAFNF